MKGKVKKFPSEGHVFTFTGLHGILPSWIQRWTPVDYRNGTAARNSPPSAIIGLTK